MYVNNNISMCQTTETLPRNLGASVLQSEMSEIKDCSTLCEACVVAMTKT